MNFTFMWSVKEHSDVLWVLVVISVYEPVVSDVFTPSFWEIAIPVMVVVIPLFLLSDLKRAMHSLEKKMTRRAITKVRHFPFFSAFQVLTRIWLSGCRSPALWGLQARLKRRTLLFGNLSSRSLWPAFSYESLSRAQGSWSTSVSTSLHPAFSSSLRYLHTALSTAMLGLIYMEFTGLA